ncbi:hypothetical protein J6590_027031 [Homalodisca vitripennis]|nr:hypothetical protein J6590_027031 [Homalodisca vitripennis]
MKFRTPESIPTSPDGRPADTCYRGVVHKLNPNSGTPTSTPTETERLIGANSSQPSPEPSILGRSVVNGGWLDGS